VHVHALVLDGVFAEESDGIVTFHSLAAPTDHDVVAVLMRRAVAANSARRSSSDAAMTRT
jgi:hypothetical protein